jgi:hypothetical protein
MVPSQSRVLRDGRNPKIGCAHKDGCTIKYLLFE